jgi:adenylate cyclase
MDLSDEYGLELWHAFGVIELGWAEAKSGRTQQGTEQMKRGMASYEATGAKLRVPYFLALMADALAGQGRFEEAIAAIERAIRMAQDSGEGYTLAELHRLNGDLLVRMWNQEQSDKVTHSFGPDGPESSPVLVRAHSCFAEALAIAKLHGAKLWELRACMSMCEIHLPSSGEKLAESSSWFTEGIETADLKRAKTLLDAIANHPERANDDR